MYGTITHLHFHDEPARAAAIPALASLMNDVSDSPAFVDGHVVQVGASEAVMVTFYRSEQDALELSASTRGHIGEAIGRYVSAPPERLAGPVVT